MSQLTLNTNAISGGSINTLSAEGGALTAPTGTNFNFSGTVAGGYGSLGGIVFSTVNPGEMNAQVQVDGVSMQINSSNQLVATGSAFSYKQITFAMSPYTVLSTDEYLSLNTSAGALSLIFPNSGSVGKDYKIKDRTGNAFTNNVTFSGSTFDGSTTLVQNINFQSDELIWNGSGYEVN